MTSPLTDQQRRGLCQVLYWAFIELRGMRMPEQAEQSSQLAYAMHNLPILIYAEDFAWEKVEGPLRYYQATYYQRTSSQGYDYVRMIEQVRTGQQVSG